VGIYYSAVALIGIVFERPDSLITTTTTPSCGHEERHGQNFCPRCGEPVRDRVVKNYNAVYESAELIEENLPDDYVFVRTYNGDFFFLGYGLTADCDDDEDGDELPLPDVEEVKKTIRGLLALAGIESIFDPNEVKLRCAMKAA
jgi:hypothetical protein